MTSTILLTLGSAAATGLLYVLFAFNGFFMPGYFRPELHYASSPVSLTIKPKVKSVAKEGRKESLKTFISTRCPSLLKEYRPVWWLFSGHLQTAYSVVGDFSKIDKVEYERTLLRTVDGGTLGLDFTPPASIRTLSEETPIVVVLHGLTGGSHESYVRAVLTPVCTPKDEGGLGYRAVVVNFRGCAGIPITSAQLYSAGHTEDIRVAMYHLRQAYPKAPLLGLGFSLGANVLTRYLAEEGENSRLAAACVVACPWDLLANSVALESRWFYRTVYSSALGSNLQGIVKRHASSLSKFSDTAVGQAVEPCLALQSPTMEMFDNTFNRIAGGSSPPFPFPTAQAYYVWASSHHILPKVRVPFLAINSKDDPIVQVLPVEAGGNEYVAFAVTEKGGHLGWFQEGKATGGLTRWFSRPVMEWLRAVGEDLEIGDRSGKSLREVDGFLKEDGRDDVGCMVIEVGGRVVGVEGQEGVLAGL